MGDITPSTLDATFQAFRVKYDAAFDATTDALEEIFETVDSKAAKETYAFLDRVPSMREWIGPRQINDFVAQAWEQANKKFELTMSVKREHIEDNLLRIYDPRLRRMGQSGKRWKTQRAKVALQGGESAACYDGRYFFATNHYVNPSEQTGAQANLFANRPLTYDNYVYVKSQMRKLKGADGEPLDDFEDLVLVVETSNEEMGNQILNSDYIVRGPVQDATGSIGGAVRNTQKGSAKLLVVPTLGNEEGTWYLASVSGEKPGIFQERYAPDFVEITDTSHPHVFMHDEFLYGIRARGEALLGAWWKLARCKSGA